MSYPDSYSSLRISLRHWSLNASLAPSDFSSHRSVTRCVCNSAPCSLHLDDAMSRQNQSIFIQKSWWTLVKQELDFETCPDIDVTIILNEYQCHRNYRRHSIQILKNKCCQRLDSKETWKNQICKVQISVISTGIDRYRSRAIDQAKKVMKSKIRIPHAIVSSENIRLD